MEDRTKKVRVLLVDDDQDLLEITQLHLSQMGFLVFCAHGADEALQRLADSSIDVVLTDIKMPGCDGKDLVKQIRANKAIRAPGLLYLTAYADELTTAEAVKTGAFQVLAKPVNKSELYRAVLAAVASTRVTAA